MCDDIRMSLVFNAAHEITEKCSQKTQYSSRSALPYIIYMSYVLFLSNKFNRYFSLEVLF